MVFVTMYCYVVTFLLPMPKLLIKWYHKHLQIGEGSVHLGVSTIYGFKYRLGIWECNPGDEGDLSLGLCSSTVKNPTLCPIL